MKKSIVNIKEVSLQWIVRALEQLIHWGTIKNSIPLKDNLSAGKIALGVCSNLGAKNAKRWRKKEEKVEPLPLYALLG